MNESAVDNFLSITKFTASSKSTALQMQMKNNKEHIENYRNRIKGKGQLFLASRQIRK